MDMGIKAIPRCKICRRLITEFVFSDDLLNHLIRHGDEVDFVHSFDDLERHFDPIKLIQ